MPIGSKTAPEPPEAYMTIGEWLTGPARGHDMSEMGPTESIAAAHIAKLDATIRRLSDENAALRLLLGDLGMGPVAIYGTDFPECPDASMHQPVEAPAPSALVTRLRNGKRYELTPADAKRFDEGEEKPGC